MNELASESPEVLLEKGSYGEVTLQTYQGMAVAVKKYKNCSKEEVVSFLRGRAASNFYAIPEGERRTYADAVKAMRGALCPPAKRENFFAEFELRALRPDEDPSVYKWELENILSKADSTLSNDAKTALLTRQFSRGLPPTLKLLEHNPTPTLNEMVEFTQRFCALGQPVAAEIPPVQVDSVAHLSSPADPKLQELITMVAGIAEKQQADGRKVGGNRAHPIVSTNTTDNCTIIHPFVDCFVDQVRVRALIDTGSIKCFVNQTVQRTIDFDDRAIDKTIKQKCVSITGHNVNIQGHLSSTVKFLGSCASFNREFLVSNNIPYDCVLGWDFISQNNLSFCKDVNLGTYIFVGKHGATPITNSQSSTTAD
ncbi:Hypothetical predicted protein [Paramuricea clavata]|uniref:Uncharacterized protein n=1 Tax=Paramuricea clavata TaxID=317549 RepID=A0A6S7G1G8_PARCT|nr:Hypothetical predicted protein [Paramuricea clavata]